jgi:hypothetical protein
VIAILSGLTGRGGLPPNEACRRRASLIDFGLLIPVMSS